MTEPIASERIEGQMETLLEMFMGTTTEATLIGRNDDVEVELRGKEFPPMSLKLRPHELYVDGSEVRGGADFPGGSVSTLANGEVIGLGDYCRVASYDVLTDGPGPDLLQLWLVTEE